MSPMCMLTDDMLPLDAASIKRKQACFEPPSARVSQATLSYVAARTRLQ